MATLVLLNFHTSYSSLHCTLFIPLKSNNSDHWKHTCCCLHTAKYRLGVKTHVHHILQNLFQLSKTDKWFENKSFLTGQIVFNWSYYTINRFKYSYLNSHLCIFNSVAINISLFDYSWVTYGPDQQLVFNQQSPAGRCRRLHLYSG